MFNNYEVLAILGTGGMGVIYKARQKILNKIVAVKMLRWHAAGPEAIQRFVREGKAASMLQHPYIVATHDFGLTAGRPYMVMDYVEGKTIGELLESEGRLHIARVLRICIQICEALAFAHSKGVLHRDIKPNNVMLLQGASGEEIRVMDFGIAKLLNDQDSKELTKTGEALGSPSYMSPEQAQRSTVDQRSDLYSLGCMMYEMLTGKTPFSAERALDVLVMHMNQKPARLSEVLSHMGETVPDELDKIVAKLLEKQPDARFQSMEELRQQLMHLQSCLEAGCLEDLPRKRNLRPKLKYLLAAGGAALGVLLCGGAFYLGQQSDANAEVADFTAPLSKTGDVETIIDSILRERSAHIDMTIFHNARFAVGGNMCTMGTELSYKTLQPLVNATNAISINFARTAVTDRCLEHISNLDLEELNLHETPVSNLSALKKMRSLVTLDLSVTRVNSAGLAVVSELKNLQSLNLSFTRISNDDLEYLKYLPKLENLSLVGCKKITDAGLLHLRQLPLKQLDLSHTQVCSLEGLRGMNSLTSLKLVRTALDNKGVAVIKTLAGLTRLNLSGTPIKDSDLLALRSLKRLTFLNLTRCANLTPSAVEELNQALPSACAVVIAENLAHVDATVPELEEHSASRPLRQAVKLRTRQCFEAALLKCQEALAEIVTSSNYQLEASIYAEQGHNQMALERFDAAIRSYDRALSVAESGKVEKPFIPMCYLWKGLAFYALKRYDQAVKWFVEAHRSFEQFLPEAAGRRSYLLNMAENLSHLTVAYNILRQSELAVQSGTEGLSLYKKCGGELTESAGQCSVALACAYERLGMRTNSRARRAQLYAKAIDAYESAMKIFRLQKTEASQVEYVSAKTLLAKTYRENGQTSSAESTLRELLTQSSPEMVRAMQYMELSLVCQMQHRTVEATEFRSRHNKIMERLGKESSKEEGGREE